MNKINGPALRNAARNDHLGKDGICYECQDPHPNYDRLAVDTQLEKFMSNVREIVSKSTEEGSFNQVEANEAGPASSMLLVSLVSVYEVAGEGFGEVVEERKTMPHSIVNRDNGNIFLVDKNNEADTLYGVRGNIFDHDAGAQCLHKGSGQLRPFSGTLREMVALGVDPNEADSFGETALMHAAAKGHVDVCKWLVQHGNADVNCRADSGATTLLKVVEKGDGFLGLCEMLVKAGADVNLANAWDTTPLHVAAFRGYLALCKLLVQHGADPKAEDKDGHTPVHYSEEDHCYILDSGERSFSDELHEFLSGL